MYFFFEKGYPSVTISTGNHLQFSSVTQSCPTLCDPINHSTPGLPVHHQLPESTQTHVRWVGDAIQPSHPLSSPLLLPSIFPSIRVFSNESALCIRWPKAWVKKLHHLHKARFPVQEQGIYLPIQRTLINNRFNKILSQSSNSQLPISQSWHI